MIEKELTQAEELTFEGLARKAGLSNRKLAERFNIPYKTAENWTAGKRKPPEYVLLMMKELLE